MTELKTNCTKCGAEFLQATASCTDGLCMPCFKGVPIEERERDVQSLSDRGKDSKMTIFDWLKAILVGGFLFVFTLIIKPLIALIICLIAHFVFGASWSASITSGFIAYFILGLLEILDGDSEDIEEEKKNEKIKEFKKRWQEKHGKSR